MAEPNLNKPLDENKMAEIETLLQDPELGNATLKFCDLITTNYSFAGVFEAAVKRRVWHCIIPDLMKIETEMMDPEFQKTLISYLSAEPIVETPITVTGLDAIGKRVTEVVDSHLKQK